MRRIISAFSALALITSPLQPLLAQQQASHHTSHHATAAGDSVKGYDWTRVTLSLRGGTFHSTGNSEAHRVVDRALTSGQAALEPFITGGSLHLPITSRWGVHVGVDGGRRTTRSESRVRPAGETSTVQQRTRFALASFVHAGMDMTAWRWRQGASLALTVGAGRAAYTLQQDGRFVDVDRLVVFEDELRSRGHGTVGYVGAAMDMPIAHWVAVRVDVRQQAGTAGMSGDFAGFDRLDLGGTRVSAGLALRPFAR